MRRYPQRHRYVYDAAPADEADNRFCHGGRRKRRRRDREELAVGGVASRPRADRPPRSGVHHVHHDARDLHPGALAELHDMADRGAIALVHHVHNGQPESPGGYAGGGAAEPEIGPMGALGMLAGVAHQAWKHHKAKRCEEGDTEYCDED